MADEKRMKWVARLFPEDHDFFAMLAHQAHVTSQGVEAFSTWLEGGKDGAGAELLGKEHEGDTEHRRLETILVEAFSTPIDRGDLYHISQELEDILDHVRDTLHEASALDVLPPQPHYSAFAAPLRQGMAALEAAIALLGKSPEAAEDQIPVVRRATKQIREVYYACLHDVAREANVNLAMRRREVYHHIRDAGVLMDEAADVLHRIIVRVM